MSFIPLSEIRKNNEIFKIKNKKILKKRLKFILLGNIIITEDKTSDSPLAMDKK